MTKQLFALGLGLLFFGTASHSKCIAKPDSRAYWQKSKKRKKAYAVKRIECEALSESKEKCMPHGSMMTMDFSGKRVRCVWESDKPAEKQPE